MPGCIINGVASDIPDAIVAKQSDFLTNPALIKGN
jgi:hypothetical protein